MVKKYQMVQMLMFQVYVIINSWYIKRSSQFYVFFTFLSSLTIFIDFALIGNDSCYSHSMQCILTS